MLGTRDMVGGGGLGVSLQQGVMGWRPHVLHPVSPVSAGRSYSEPRSMGERGGLGDSHGKHVERSAADRKEQVGFFGRLPHPFLPPPS